MKKHTPGLLGFLLAIAGLLSCVKFDDIPDYNPDLSGGLFDSNGIVLWNSRFTPETLKVKRGETVNWENWDTGSHKISSTNSNFNAFEIGGQSDHKSIMNFAGTFEYRCDSHGERGVLIVEF